MKNVPGTKYVCKDEVVELNKDDETKQIRNSVQSTLI